MSYQVLLLSDEGESVACISLFRILKWKGESSEATQGLNKKSKCWRENELRLRTTMLVTTWSSRLLRHLLLELGGGGPALALEEEAGDLEGDHLAVGGGLADLVGEAEADQ